MSAVLRRRRREQAVEEARLLEEKVKVEAERQRDWDAQQLAAQKAERLARKVAAKAARVAEANAEEKE